MSLVFQVESGLNDNVLPGAVVRVATGIQVISNRQIVRIYQVHLQNAYGVCAGIDSNRLILHDPYCFCIM